MAFKLKSANFYIDILETIGKEDGFSRLAGIEMALDRALAALRGAFDASVAGVTRSTVDHFRQGQRGAPLPWTEVPEHLYKWRHCTEVIRYLQPQVARVWRRGSHERGGWRTSCEGRRSLGWLVELQDLRNRTVHQQSIARHIGALAGSSEPADWALIVGGRTNKDGSKHPERPEGPVHYLRAARQRVTNLTAQLVDLAEYVCPNGIPRARPTEGTSGPSAPSPVGAQ